MRYIKFSSVAQLCPALCNPMGCSMPGFPVHHHLLELALTHVHWVSGAIQIGRAHVWTPDSVNIFIPENMLRITESKLWDKEQYANLCLHDSLWRVIGKDPDAGKDRGQEGKGATEDEMVGWYHWLNGHEFEQALGDGDGQGSLACCSPWGCKELDTDRKSVV